MSSVPMAAKSAMASVKLAATLFPRAWTKLCVIGVQGAMTW